MPLTSNHATGTSAYTYRAALKLLRSSADVATATRTTILV